MFISSNPVGRQNADCALVISLGFLKVVDNAYTRTCYSLQIKFLFLKKAWYCSKELDSATSH